MKNGGPTVVPIAMPNAATGASGALQLAGRPLTRCCPMPPPMPAMPCGWPHGFDIVFVQRLVRNGPKQGAKRMKMTIGLVLLLVLAGCGVPIVPLI